MSIPKGKARGNQGNWFAEVTAPRCPEIDGKSLPCIWDFWVAQGGKHYLDEGYAPEHSKFPKVTEALSNGKLAIMRKRKISDDPNNWESAGYIAVFEIANVKTDGVLKFDIVRRVCDLD